MLLTGLAITSHAAEPPNLEDCREIDSPAGRLACYDSIPGKSMIQYVAPDAPDVDAKTADKPPAGCTSNLLLDQAWDKCNDTKKVAAYKPNYIVLHGMSAPNNSPFSNSSEFTGPQQSANLNHAELKFQVSAKTILASNLPGDSTFWFAYTQQSYWQVFDGSRSRPFRETNYNPELIWSFATPNGVTLPGTGLKQHYVNLALQHESNGRGLGGSSRSWNRLSAQFSFEDTNRNLLLVRPWWRIPERESSDNNPDIHRYMGYGDVTYVKAFDDGNAISVLLRNNLQTRNNRGALQFDWSFQQLGGGLFSGICGKCRIGNLNWHLQVFSGYGESLVDYNHRQNTIGIGIDLIPQLGNK